MRQRREKDIQEDQSSEDEDEPDLRGRLLAPKKDAERSLERRPLFLRANLGGQSGGGRGGEEAQHVVLSFAVSFHRLCSSALPLYKQSPLPRLLTLDHSVLASSGLFDKTLWPAPLMD